MSCNVVVRYAHHQSINQNFSYKLIGFRIEQKYSIVCFGVYMWSVTTLCFLLSDILCLVILVVVAFIFSFLKWEVYLLCLFMVRFDLVNLVKQVLENRMYIIIMRMLFLIIVRIYIIIMRMYIIIIIWEGWSFGGRWVSEWLSKWRFIVY